MKKNTGERLTIYLVSNYDFKQDEDFIIILLHAIKQNLTHFQM